MPSYFAIIPANVRYDKDLTPNAKLLYGEITALCNEKGYCWASNSYFSELYKVSNKSISLWVKQLIEKGYISSELKYKGNTKEIESRYLRIVPGGIEEKVNTPMEENVKDNNTVINNTFNIPYVEIVNYLNAASNKNYQSKTKKTRDLIKARWNEGFRLEDFKKVIDKKISDWINDEKYSDYIRPNTLFGPKFEGYLNEKSKNKKPLREQFNLAE